MCDWILTCFISIALWLMGFQCLLHWLASPAWITRCSPRPFLLLVKTHMGEKACVCNQCGGDFRKHPSLKQHREFRLEKNHYESLCWKAFEAHSVLSNLRNFTLARNPVNECGWASSRVCIYTDTREFTQRKSDINIMDVGKMSARKLTFIHFREHSLTVIIVEKPLLIIYLLKDMSRFTLESSPRSVITVEGPPAKLHPQCTQENSEWE